MSINSEISAFSKSSMISKPSMISKTSGAFRSRIVDLDYMVSRKEFAYNRESLLKKIPPKTAEQKLNSHVKAFFNGISYCMNKFGDLYQKLFKKLV